MGGCFPKSQYKKLESSASSSAQSSPLSNTAVFGNSSRSTSTTSFGSIGTNNSSTSSSYTSLPSFGFKYDSRKKK